MSQNHKDVKFQLFRQAMLADFERMSHVTDPALLRLQERYLKRFATNDRKLTDKAIADFKETLVNMRNVTLSLDSAVVLNARHFIWRALVGFTVKNVDPLSKQCCLSYSYLLSTWRFGPGASNGIEGTHFAEKIVQDMTVTTNCTPYVKLLRRLNPYLARYDMSNGMGIRRVRGSKLNTVPKNNETARTIATEPSGNMALQLAAGSYLENVLRFIGLDITTQADKNKKLAQLGSLYGHLATLDLQSASDRISFPLVCALYPPEWVSLFRSIRSEEIEINGEFHELTMVSTMGNGFTFPLMTLTIAALLYGYYASIEVGRPNRIDWSENAVFGDDIIIPAEHYEGFSEVLEGAGFIVNKMKSYSTGPFRESCGGDFYNGVDITPFYIESLNTDPELYIAINKTLAWANKTNLVCWNALRLFKSLIKGAFHCVPEWEQPYSGVQTKDVRKVYSLIVKSPSYKTLQVTRKSIPDSLELLMLCILGNYVTSISEAYNRVRYMPRGHVGYKVIRRQLPRGRLDGRESLIRTHEVGATRPSDIIPWL